MKEENFGKTHLSQEVKKLGIFRGHIGNCSFITKWDIAEISPNQTSKTNHVKLRDFKAGALNNTLSVV